LKSDAEIVTEVLADDSSAYGLLVRRYERVARAVATQILGDFHLAEDVAQEAFVAAYEKLATLRNREVFGPWFVRIVQNRARSLVRRAPRTEPLDENIPDPSPGSNGQLDDLSKHLLDTVNRLPEPERQVVMLKYFGGYNTQDIVEMIGASDGTIRKRLSRALTRLRKRLKG
jgi:RNA polymerase sigma-70 factor (ECF subfamily)